MNVLHTSDWHLGHLLYQQKREEEHRGFLEWLLDLIKLENVGLLLIAGDVFDSGLPSNYALEMYFSFLARCAAHGCHQVVVVGGNHDSPSTLQAPRDVLKALEVFVVGTPDSEHPEHDVITVSDATGIPQAVVAAIPYLRDREVFVPKPGDSLEVRAQGIIAGTVSWYRRLIDVAQARRQDLGRPDLPIIATGHLFARGMTKSGTERDLYVGDLGAFPVSGFPAEAEYIALGHLHRAQEAAEDSRVRYSGSPLPCSFDEAGQKKQVFLFDTAAPRLVRSIEVPIFRSLVKMVGDLPTIRSSLQALQMQPLTTWVEVSYTGLTLLPDLPEQVNALAAELPFPLQVLSCRDMSPPALAAECFITCSHEPTPEEVFQLRLDQAGLAPEDHELVCGAFQEILLQVREEEES